MYQLCLSWCVLEYSTANFSKAGIKIIGSVTVLCKQKIQFFILKYFSHKRHYIGLVSFERKFDVKMCTAKCVLVNVCLCNPFLLENVSSLFKLCK